MGKPALFALPRVTQLAETPTPQRKPPEVLGWA